MTDILKPCPCHDQQCVFLHIRTRLPPLTHNRKCKCIVLCKPMEIPEMHH